jgi:predicted transcriptional regulator of viral defense system
MAEQYRFWYCSAMIKEARKTYRERLFEVAQNNHGFVTTKDAVRMGIPTIELRKLAHRGKLEHVSRGVYQFEQLTGSANESFLRATLHVGVDAYLTADAVLAVHDLANVNPKVIRVGIAKRTRQAIPKGIELMKTDALPQEIEVRNGIKMTRVARAIIDSKHLVMRERLQRALEDALERGLVTNNERGLVELALQ